MQPARPLVARIAVVAARFAVVSAQLGVVACAGCAPVTEDDGEPLPGCAQAVDTADAATFFASLACSYTLLAADTGAAGDASLGAADFVHGAPVEVTITAAGTVTLGVLTFTTLSTYADQPNEANALLDSVDAGRLVVQWRKGARELVLAWANGDASWRFTAVGPASPLLPSDTHGDLGFMVGTHAGPLTLVTGSDAELCAPLAVVIDAQANASVSLGAPLATFAAAPTTFAVATFAAGDDDVTLLSWQLANDDALTLELRAPGEETPALARIVVDVDTARYEHDAASLACE